MIDLDVLSTAIRRSWDAWTSADPKWSSKNAAGGQCAVTALVVQDYLGGHLLRQTVNGQSHYWNLVHGVEVDLTREQFDVVRPDDDPVERSRVYVLSFPDTLRRYRRLAERVAEKVSA